MCTILNEIYFKLTMFQKSEEIPTIEKPPIGWTFNGGDTGTRTRDLLHAMQAL